MFFLCFTTLRSPNSVWPVPVVSQLSLTRSKAKQTYEIYPLPYFQLITKQGEGIVGGDFCALYFETNIYLYFRYKQAATARGEKTPLMDKLIFKVKQFSKTEFL